MADANDPSYLRIPEQFQNDDTVFQFFQDLRQNQVDLWRRSGEDTDLVENSEQVQTFVNTKASRNIALLSDIKERTPFTVVTTTDITTKLNMVVICKNTEDITVTLDPNALKDDTVRIKRRDAKVTLNGVVDGVANTIINVVNYSMTLIYDGAEWNEV